MRPPTVAFANSGSCRGTTCRAPTVATNPKFMKCNSTMTKLTHGLAHFLLGLFVFLGLPAIPLFLALRQRQFALGDALTEVYAQWNERQALVVQFSLQLADLLLAQQQLARSERPMVEGPSGKVFANVEVDQPDLA